MKGDPVYPSPGFPSVNISHNCRTFVKTINVGKLLLKNYRFHLDFSSFYTDVLFLFQDLIQVTTLHLDENKGTFESERGSC